MLMCPPPPEASRKRILRVSILKLYKICHPFAYKAVGMILYEAEMTRLSLLLALPTIRSAARRALDRRART